MSYLSQQIRAGVRANLGTFAGDDSKLLENHGDRELHLQLGQPHADAMSGAKTEAQECHRVDLVLVFW